MTNGIRTRIDDMLHNPDAYTERQMIAMVLLIVRDDRRVLYDHIAQRERLVGPLHQMIMTVLTAIVTAAVLCILFGYVP